MIADQLPTRLYWIGMRGFARLNGNHVKLSAPPQVLPGLTIDGIDYSPGHVCMVLPRHAGWREMTAEERAGAEQVLQDKAGA